ALPVPSTPPIPACTSTTAETSTPGQSVNADTESTLAISVPETPSLSGLNRHLVKNDVTKAEILWALNCVMSHISMSAGGKAVKLFPKMFSDSIIAAKMELGRTKLSYTVVHGLAPYFHDKLLHELLNVEFFVSMFDESLNKCSQKNQMDIAVRFWSASSDEVVTHYFTSAFLGRSKSSNLVEAFVKKFNSSLLRRLLMISLDGPSVNFKFLKELQVHLKGEHGPDEPILLLMGSCGLHVVHNAFKTGVNAAGWGIVGYLRATYNVFKDVPARRSKYTLWTGSTKFPQKYCAVRWLNNASVADTGRKILPNLETFVDHVESGGREDKIVSASYSCVKKSLKDKLLGPKLAFFSYVARLVEPFLTAYQTNNPMAPFLHTDLTAVMKDLLSIFLKEDCITIVKRMVEKILEKSPLAYKLCKAITFCDPELIVKSEAAALKRLRDCLTVVQERHWFTSLECDTIESEFKALIRKASVLNGMREYDRDRTRLDHHWKTIWTLHKSSKLLIKLLQMVLSLSHGNAFPERGFSINKEVIVENQLDNSLVALRQVYDAVNSAGGIDNIEIDSKMISRVRHARAEYQESQKERQKEEKEKTQKRMDQNRIWEDIKELKAKKMKLMIENNLECEAIDSQIQALVGSQ
ncbi:hypothetical protein FOCC_FOCC005271, partial [Frankliniella occidentalis]